MSTQSLTHVDAKTLKHWLDDGRAVLIDVREADEHAREHIPGARLVPLSGFNAADFAQDHCKVGVFHCQSGARTEEAAARILKTGFDEVYHLQGGLAGWKAAGFPVNLNRSAPISVMRQVQITAGLMVVLGIVLALLISPWFMGLSAFVGAGLTFAGVTGTCALASVLRLMPWNKQAGAATGGAPVLGQI
ncbi:MAG: rhodanese family protein [Pseudomonadota bacterium]